MELFHAKEKKTLLSRGRGTQKTQLQGRRLEKLLWFGRGFVYNSIFALENKFIPFLLFFFKQLHRFLSAFLICQKKMANPVTWNMKQICSNLRLQPVKIWVSLTHLVPWNSNYLIYITSFLPLKFCGTVSLKKIKIIKVTEKKHGIRGRSCTYTLGFLFQVQNLY